MFIKLAVLFIFVPICEIFVLLQANNTIGTLWTVGLVILTGISGAMLMRHEGFSVLTRIQTALAQGHLPASELMDAALILVGGVLLLTPGFLTDLTGFIILTPWSRSLIKNALLGWMRQKLERGEIVIRRV